MNRIMTCFIFYSLIFSFNTFSQYAWVQQTSGTSFGFYSVYFVDNNTGWVVGSHGIILKTTNSGDLWTQQVSNINDSTFFSVNFSNNSTGWICGLDGVILLTTNGGSNWKIIDNSTQNIFYSIDFVNDNTGWVVGQFGTILKTTNGGNNWFSQVTGSSIGLASVSFADDMHGCAVGFDSGLVLYTSNAGLNWSIQYLGDQYTILRSVNFVNSTTGFTVGPGGIIFSTSNGGQNWIKYESSFISTYTSTFFVTPLLGWVVGMNGVIRVTTNGGSNWEGQLTGVTNYLWGVYFPSIDTGWAVGANGLILKTTTSGFTPVTIINLTVPEDYYLHQNFPNPFNPITTIKFEIPIQSKVTLKIYNTLGMEIVTLVDENINAGSYEVRWNAINYSSGVYYFRLEASNTLAGSSQVFSEIRKLVLVK